MRLCAADVTPRRVAAASKVSKRGSGVAEEVRCRMKTVRCHGREDTAHGHGVTCDSETLSCAYVNPASIRDGIFRLQSIREDFSASRLARSSPCGFQCADKRNQFTWNRAGLRPHLVVSTVVDACRVAYNGYCVLSPGFPRCEDGGDDRGSSTDSRSGPRNSAVDFLREISEAGGPEGSSGLRLSTATPADGEHDGLESQADAGAECCA